MKWKEYINKGFPCRSTSFATLHSFNHSTRVDMGWIIVLAVTVMVALTTAPAAYGERQCRQDWFRLHGRCYQEKRPDTFVRHL